MDKVKPTTRQAEKAVRTLIAFFGDNPDRLGVQDTPKRFLKAWKEDWGKGYGPEPVLSLFPELAEFPLYPDQAKHFDQLVIVKDLTWHSHCEHHLAPFFGTAHVCYFPSDKGLIGLSKFARVVTHFASRLQVQERLTEQIADYLQHHSHSKGVGVILRGTHMCMCSRGVYQTSSSTITSAMRGILLDDSPARAEFLKLSV